jgi:myosin heavy subunit
MSITDAAETQTDEQDTDQPPTASEFRALKDRLAEVEAENDRLRERVEELEQQTEQNENATDYAHERVDDLDATVDRGLEYAHERIDAFAESKVEVESTRRNPDTDNRNTGDSPLKQITDLPQHVAEEQLSENQQRARFVAKDVLDYADNTPKGYVVDSATVSKVLAVRDSESPHTETVSRTMDFLDRFGKSGVETRMHKGRRIAVFDAEAAKRYGTGTIAPSQCGVIGPQATG